MSRIDLPAAKIPDRDDDFASTRWSLVLAAGDANPAAAREALGQLCQLYWYPLYAYVRRRTLGAHAAQDLTQAFFVYLLEHKAIAVARSDRGRFRAFLLTSLRHFLANEREREHAAKRGGGRPAIDLDFASGESRLGLEPATTMTPERAFEREWTLTLLERVIQRLEEEMAAAGKAAQFGELKALLVGATADQTYAAAALRLAISQEAARQAVHRLRKRYRELLREEVAQTVADPADVDDEIRGLMATLSE